MRYTLCVCLCGVARVFVRVPTARYEARDSMRQAKPWTRSWVCFVTIDTVFVDRRKFAVFIVYPACV
jgi:hypothetical protein